MARVFLGGLLFLTLGVFIFLKPELLWRLTERWKSYNADEPSDMYIIGARVGGVLFALFGAAIMILPYVIK